MFCPYLLIYLLVSVYVSCNKFHSLFKIPDTFFWFFHSDPQSLKLNLVVIISLLHSTLPNSVTEELPLTSFLLLLNKCSPLHQSYLISHFSCHWFPRPLWCTVSWLLSGVWELALDAGNNKSFRRMALGELLKSSLVLYFQLFIVWVFSWSFLSE